MHSGFVSIGKICLVRYGRIFRGNKVLNCQNNGAIGIIIFSDPDQVAPEGTDPEDVYPNSQFLPPSGVQRGSILNFAASNGDPLSLGWPSVDGAYRWKENETADNVFPKVPCQPISYGDAKHIVEKLGGYKVPTDWQGKIANVTYRYDNMSILSYSNYTDILLHY